MCRNLLAVVVLGLVGLANAHDWTRFRGPNGGGVAESTKPTPTEWSPQKNLKWKVALPGPGSSCPILVGDKIFVTCWTGYAAGGERGEQKDLKRHLLCLDRATGKTIWDQTVDTYLPEDNYGGMFAENGYCSHTPVSDGKKVFVFFGKSGVFAFDLDGKQLWKQSVGHGSGAMGWGSSSSPILCNDLVIVPATAESQTLYAFDKETGKEVWKSHADGFASTWGTPVVVDLEGGKSEIVVGVPYEIWAFNPKNGKLNWYCEALNMRSFCSSVITDGKGNVFAMGDQGAGSVAVKAGGKGDAKANIVWTNRDTNRIGSPLLVDDKLYFVSNRIANCVSAKDGKRIFQGRLTGGAAAPTPVTDDEEGRPRGPGGFSGRGGRGGGRGGQDYSSPVAADGKLYFITRNGDGYVLKLGDKFEQLAMNRVTEDSEDFSATPAIADGAIFIRSSKHLYCVAE